MVVPHDNCDVICKSIAKSFAIFCTKYNPIPVERLKKLPASPVSGDEVAVDSVGAGTGELVLLSSGSSARHVFSGPNEAIDLAIVGIVDTLSR